jgi:type II secretory pathway pseudopilin PulG
MTPVEWLAFVVLLIVGVAAGAAVTLSNGVVARAICNLEQTYRRQKSLELEQLQAQVVARRRAEVETLLAEPEGWRKVIDQLLADALPDITARVGKIGVLDLSAAPVPRFSVAGVNGQGYLFTTSPEALRRVGLLRQVQVVHTTPLDASLHPAARVEVQAVWEHLAAQRLPGECPYSTVLPRQAEWFLMVLGPGRREAKKR